MLFRVSDRRPGIYVQRIIERLLDRIEPDDQSGEMPLMPILNRYKPIGTMRMSSSRQLDPVLLLR